MNVIAFCMYFPVCVLHNHWTLCLKKVYLFLADRYNWIAKFCCSHKIFSVCRLSVPQVYCEIQRGSSWWGAQPMFGWLTTLSYCTLHIYIWRHIASGPPEPIVVVAVGAINMQSTAVHHAVRYSNGFDTTTAT